MSVYDPRVDAYIEKSAPFAQPILNHLRDLIHTHCPDVVETIKWGFPHFEYNKRAQFYISAFKQHCAFGFWLASLMTDTQGILQVEEKASMGSLGRITSLKDLPSNKVMKDYIKQSMKLTDEGVKKAKNPVNKEKAVEIEVPDYFIAALKKNKKALAVFEKFAPSHRKEYLEWITDAKREETRNKRIAEAIEWMAEGKSRHWKYQ
jgi:uncharacterized protein YdeI (YjbR/CyaY-like superfamily)